MIKRRFFKQEHGDRDDDGDSSDSSSSDSDAPPPNDASDDDDDVVEEEEEEEAKERPLSPSSGSGYESEDSSGNEVACDSSGLPINEEECSDGATVPCKDDQLIDEEALKSVAKASSPKDSIPDPDNCILKFKKVFKCRLCPKIVILNENTAKMHLSSKRHSRSKKLLGEGRLRLMLNSDGEVEEEQETHAERHARTIALAQKEVSPKKKSKGRKRGRKRKTKRTPDATENGRSEESTKKDKKKRRKIEDK